MYRKAEVLFGKFAGQTVDVEGTDHEVWGKSWAMMNGNPCALEFAIRSATTETLDLGESLRKPVYYCTLDRFGMLFAERQLKFTEPVAAEGDHES
jgi:hypothetical protein